MERGTLRELRARVGLVFQDPDDQLFMPTVREDVAFGPLNLGLDRRTRCARARGGGAAAPCGWTHAADRAPAPALAWASAGAWRSRPCSRCDPALLVLDEPSANLDPRARRELLEVLERIDRTMLVVTHDLPFAAELCERAVVLVGRARRRRRRRATRCSPTRSCSPRHDLELPAGFDLARDPAGARGPAGPQGGRPCATV